MEINFLVNFSCFSGFLVLEAILKYLLKSLNDYGKLETFNPGYWAEASLGVAFGVRGIVESDFIINFNFSFFVFW